MKGKASAQRKKTVILLVALGLLLFLDQWTKYLAVLHLRDGKALSILPGVFALQYLENRGMAFGLLQNQRWLFLCLTVVFLAVFLFFYYRLPWSKRYVPMGLCMLLLLSGAVGNFIDRVRYGYVIDFLYITLIDFPIFNVADCYVVIAVFLFLFLFLFYYQEEELTCLSVTVFGKRGRKE